MLYFKRILQIVFLYTVTITAPFYADTMQTQTASDEPTEQELQKELFADVPQTSPFSKEQFDRLILKMYVSSFNFPSYWFEDGQWRMKTATCFISGGKDEIVSPYQFNIMKRVHYYRYINEHPLDPSYYAQDEQTLRFLSRFCFYRFTGKTLLPAVDVHLFVLDMHTGLLFSYAIPSRFDKILGHGIPRDWVALETHPYVLEHFPGKKFYEFDPIGIVQADKKVLLYDWTIARNKLKKDDLRVYIPRLDDYSQPASKSGPGYSPYRINTKKETPINRDERINRR